jgi:hypothetical protein
MLVSLFAMLFTLDSPLIRLTTLTVSPLESFFDFDSFFDSLSDCNKWRQMTAKRTFWAVPFAARSNS